MVLRQIVDNSVINQKNENFQFKDFIKDERQMATLFEEFIRNFYKIEVPEEKVFKADLR